ncbi:MAG: tetratricopeptide repeat protein [Actinobacteria bacterium]|nr:tetratricopeptide repeat protein [Actinomycetota bacterium]
MAKNGSHVIDVTDATFASAVVEESFRRPVVVDFWAGWCQPCRMIGPVLERMAEDAAGGFLLAKLDVDANPETSTAFRIQSIPAVKGFRDGSVADEFIGVIPEQAIRQFLTTLLPSESDELARRGLDAEAAGRTAEAGDLFARAVKLQPGHLEASLGLGRLAALRGELEEARRTLEPLRPNPEAERILAAVEVSGWASRDNGSGPVAMAERAAAEGRFDEALDRFLAQVRAGGEASQEARASMLKLFAVLGEQDPLTRDYRRKLAAALF